MEIRENQSILGHPEQRKIAKSGGTSVVYLPKEAKELLALGDTVTVKTFLEGRVLRIVIEKILFNFDLQTVRNSLAKGFDIEYENKLGDILVFVAKKNKTTISYTQSLNDPKSPAHVIVTRMFSDLSPKQYLEVAKTAGGLRSRFDTVIRPEGDLDTISVLENPARFELRDVDEAAKRLGDAGKQLGLSIVLRFNSSRDSIEHVQEGAKELSELGKGTNK